MCNVWPFEIYKAYNRRRDIHGPYGGQQQGGISTPSDKPGIFIFTVHGARSTGYQDELCQNGTFRYTGQGQIGDMKMTAGNRAIRDHVKNGKDLLLFRQTKKGGPVIFEGLFVCSGWEIEQQLDVNGQLRKAIVFTLVPQNGLRAEAEELATAIRPLPSLIELKDRALRAAIGPQQESGQKALITIWERSKAVKDYILARAAGTCEKCKKEAPFLTPKGQPYLEVHHIRKLSDGGLDHPHYVAAICPNCHRQAHFGADHHALNEELLNYVKRLEEP